MVDHLLVETENHMGYCMLCSLCHLYTGFPSQVGFRVQYPEDYQGLSYEDLKEFKQTRYGNQSGVLLVLNITLDQDLLS